MKSYRIGFFNELRNDSGHMFHCCQRVVEIRLAKTKERAIEAAKRRFAHRERISNWSIHARSIEVEEIENVDVPRAPR
jgi:hypothetical protein